MRELYVLPPNVENMKIHEVLEWATDEVLRLDQENQRLRERIMNLERIQARTAGPTASKRT